MLLHATLVAVAISGPAPQTAPRRAVACAVLPSMLQPAAPASAPLPEGPARTLEVLVEPAATPPNDEPVILEPLADPPTEAPAPGPTDRRPPTRLDDALRTNIVLRPAPPTPAPPAAVEASAAPAAPAAAEARPEVPVVRPGHNPAPEYPDSARRARVEGTVLVRIDVDTGGGIVRCTVTGSSGSVALDLAALAAARRWRFEQGPGVVLVPFVFRLMPRRGSG